MSQPLVRQWMTPNPITVAASASVDEAHQLMKAVHVRHLPVLDGSTLVGLISKTDIHRAKLHLAAEEGQTALTTAEIVSHTRHISAEASIATAAQEMLTHQISALPVVDNGRLHGILTEADIFRMVAETTTND